MTEASADDWNGKLHISNNAVDAEKLLASLQKRIIVDIEVTYRIHPRVGLVPCGLYSHRRSVDQTEEIYPVLISSPPS